VEPPDGRIGRFVFEYVGNLDGQEPRADRRRNRKARELVDWVKQEMEERGFPATTEQAFLEDLREAIRQEAWMTTEEGIARASPPETLFEGKE
jgi:hypothetical protein